MPPSDRPSGPRPDGLEPGAPRPTGAGPTGERRGAGPDPLDESWDPVDDAVGAVSSARGWDWGARTTWGQRAVAGFPLAAVVFAILLFVGGTAAAPGPPAPQVVGGSDGARLVAQPGAPVPTDAAAPGGPARYGVVTFDAPSGPSHPIQGSTSLALPPYVGWEQNGSAGPGNGVATVDGGLLHVGVRHSTSGFRGWFLTTTGSVPDSCAFQFDAASPPDLPAGSPASTTGELVMAVQTANTAITGDINYVVVAEIVHADGSRVLQAGYSTGHVRNAVERVLARVPWGRGGMHVSVETDGDQRLEVWVDNRVLFDATDLHMGITPPFQPYLEVQAVGTPYSVAFSRYASVCGDDVAVDGLPDGSLVALGSEHAVAWGGRALLPLDRSRAPVTGRLEVSTPDGSSVRSFDAHTYWPGDRFAYQAPPG
jgi:hypothetical protein